MSELQQLRDEIAQLQTALTIKNGTIEQLKARVAELEKRQVAYACSHCGSRTEAPAPYASYVVCSKCRCFTAATLAAGLASRVTPQQTPARQVPEGLHEVLLDIWCGVCNADEAYALISDMLTTAPKESAHD